MYAYALDGTPIKSTKEVTPGTCAITDGSYRRLKDGTIDVDYSGGTEHDYDQQSTVEINGEQIFVDDGGDEWPACSLILLESELEDGEQLPADLVEAAQAAYDTWQSQIDRDSHMRKYIISKPETGWRALSDFTPEEKAKLRPVAETLAMLDGNAFFFVETDDAGDDIFYEQYLPEAHALVEANGGWAIRASFLRDPSIKIEPGMPGTLPIRYHAGERVVDLVDQPDVVIEITDIDWDTSDDDIVDGRKPHLPTHLYAGVPANWGHDNHFVDLLSDRYGFLVNGVSSAEPLTSIDGIAPTMEPATKG